jgi:uncharacterized Zn finger protein
MDALDGNAIAGELAEVYGRDMTIAYLTCVSCGTEQLHAEVVVYGRPPGGTVARCRACGDVLFVLVTVRGETRITTR